MSTASTATPSPAWKIAHQGDRTLLLTLDQPLSVALGQQCTAAAAMLRQAQIKGISDIVPTFNTVAVHYQPLLFGASSYLHFVKEIQKLLTREQINPHATTTPRLVDIPVCYGGQYGPDLNQVAQWADLSPEQVITLHSQSPAYVFMLGFAPGAPYIGLHDEKLNIPRHATPRTELAAGSVAIANRQTIIYPNASPGGWHVIGATPLRLFDPSRAEPSTLAPGDNVRFVPITPDEFIAMQKNPL